MVKVTILYGHPRSAEAFEAYYAGPHRAVAARMTGMAKVELTKFEQGLDGGRPPFYRMAELYFEDAAQVEKWKTSPEGQAALADLQNFATGGVSFAVGSIITR